jgi:glycosyltransferase involved in cell wall biosynthesis
MEPLVSILIPAYNAEEWVSEALRSAIAQTWSNREVIVVDDGSTDETLSVARRFESAVVKIVPQTNQGASAARNTALSLCQGDYIQWLDADDLLAPDKIAKQMEVVEKGADPRVLFSSSWSRFFYNIRRARPAENSLWHDLSPREWLIRKLRGDDWIAIESWLTSRQLINEIGAWNTSLSVDDDGEYVCRLVSACKEVKFVRSSMSYVRQLGGESRLSFGMHDADKWEAQLSSVKIQVETILRFNNSPELRQACVGYLQRWLLFWYPERPDLVQQTHELAAKLDGVLERPRLPRKYDLLQKVMGLGRSKRAERAYNSLKWRLIAAFDRELFRFRG